MKNLIIRKISMTGSFAPLASSPSIGSFTLRAGSSGAGAVLLKADDASQDVNFDRGVQFVFERVNLADIQAKGALGDYILVLGATT
ncbi:MAG: hypothetical protein L0219_13775 [Phycisphaerales bacterium]|nr:hypothetical protein [Phycisphaerales bacterium]